jgi:hypothetical protein
MLTFRGSGNEFPAGLAAARPDGHEAVVAFERTPALWISNGTGRDGNRHTWLGFASAGGRMALAD